MSAKCQSGLTQHLVVTLLPRPPMCRLKRKVTLRLHIAPARFVHRQNIEHYREMLKTITDPAQREKIKKLLAEEDAAIRKAVTDCMSFCPLWVTSRHFAAQSAYPLYPQKQTFFEALGLFATCHKGTFRYSSDHLFGRKNALVFGHRFAGPTKALCNSVTACAS